MASPGNQHCASCIGTLSFPILSRRHAAAYDELLCVSRTAMSSIQVILIQNQLRPQNFSHLLHIYLRSWTCDDGDFYPEARETLGTSFIV